MKLFKRDIFFFFIHYCHIHFLCLDAILFNFEQYTVYRIHFGTFSYSVSFFVLSKDLFLKSGARESKWDGDSKLSLNEADAPYRLCAHPQQQVKVQYVR